jgi:hypothetical protein
LVFLPAVNLQFTCFTDFGSALGYSGIENWEVPMPGTAAYDLTEMDNAAISSSDPNTISVSGVTRLYITNEYSEDIALLQGALSVTVLREDWKEYFRVSLPFMPSQGNLP